MTTNNNNNSSTFTIKSGAIGVNGKPQYGHIIENLSASEVANIGATSVVMDFAEQAAAAFDGDINDINDEIDEAFDWVNDWLDMEAAYLRESVTVIDETHTTMTPSYMPPCPVCGCEPDTEADFDHAYDCEHSIGTYHEWTDDAGDEYVMLEQATHEVRINQGIGGIQAYFFHGFASNVELQATKKPVVLKHYGQPARPRPTRKAPRYLVFGRNLRQGAPWQLIDSTIYSKRTDARNSADVLYDNGVRDGQQDFKLVLNTRVLTWTEAKRLLGSDEAIFEALHELAVTGDV